MLNQKILKLSYFNNFRQSISRPQLIYRFIQMEI